MSFGFYIYICFGGLNQFFMNESIPTDNNRIVLGRQTSKLYNYETLKMTII